MAEDHVTPDWRKRLESTVDRHDKDLYFGDERKPGLTTRMALMEECVEGIRSNLGKIVWLLVGLFLTGILDVVVRMAKL